MRITFENDIKAPIAVVWPLLADDQKIPLWMPELVDITYPDGRDRENLVGTQFRQTLKEGGRSKTYKGVVTAYEPEQLLGICLRDGSFGVDVTYRLSPTKTGTRLDYAADMQLASVFTKILGFLFKPLTVKIIKRHMVNLKRVAEEEGC